MDAVDPQVHEVGAGKIAFLEGLRLVLPLGCQPGDRGRRESGAGSEELFEGRAEVTGGQAVQIQQR